MHRENYHAVMGTNVDLLKHPVVSAAVGTAAMAVGAAESAYRVAEKVPIFGPLMQRGVAELSERGDKWVTQSADQFKALVATSRTDVYTIGAFGCGAWSPPLEAARARGGATIRLAWDVLRPGATWRVDLLAPRV